jgi:AraC-like DNA-binding protein
MSQYERKMDYLNKRRLIYRRNPITDKPSAKYEWGDFYEDGTHECYTLFQTKAKINTYKSLKWHLLVLWYLNDHLDQDAFEDLASFISDKENGFVTFNVSPQLLEKIIYDVSIQDLERPPKNKIRKIIFRDNSGLTTKEKLAIVGRMVGKRKLSETEIYDAMLMLHDENEKITIAKLADHLGCSTRTVHRNMGVELKKEKELLNQEL